MILKEIVPFPEAGAPSMTALKAAALEKQHVDNATIKSILSKSRS